MPTPQETPEQQRERAPETPRAFLSGGRGAKLPNANKPATLEVPTHAANAFLANCQGVTNPHEPKSTNPYRKTRQWGQGGDTQYGK